MVTLIFVCLILKIFRKATYLVALKASRMNNLNSDSGVFNDKELDYALERVCEDDHDEFGFTPNCRYVGHHSCVCVCVLYDDDLM